MKQEQSINQEVIKKIAAQLRCPSGFKGLEVAALMHRTNINMTMCAILSLELKNNDCLLELGHGNCGHLKQIQAQVENIKYHGLETSILMTEEAKKRNLLKKSNSTTVFLHYDGLKIPYPNAFFNKIMTVNTLYFWKNPINLLQQIYNVLKTKGLLTIVFADKSYMKSLPFSKLGFTLYSKKEFQNLVANTNFRLLSILSNKEMIEDKMGNFVVRKFYVAKLIKEN